MKKKFIYLSAIFALISCSEPKEKKDYNIQIETKKIDPQTIHTKIKTNFPDNTPFTITASRDYKRENSSENYSIDLFYSYKSIVKNGSIEFNFDPTDKQWLNEYKELQKQNGEFDKTLTNIDIQSIKDTIEISVLYTPKAEQNNDLKKLFGEKGENLKGVNVEDNGNFKIFRKTIKIYDKYD